MAGHSLVFAWSGIIWSTIRHNLNGARQPLRSQQLFFSGPTSRPNTLVAGVTCSCEIRRTPSIIIMNPLLEVNPSACLFVIGPALTALWLSEHARHVPTSSKTFAESAISYAGRSKSVGENKLRNVRELCTKRPSLACHESVKLLQNEGCFEDWLKQTFSIEEEGSTPPAPCKSLQHLLELHEQGALLACTQYDTVLDAMACSTPVTVNDISNVTAAGRSDLLKKWSQGSKEQKILHLHGVHTQAASMQTDISAYAPDASNSAISSPTSRSLLKQVFLKRLLILVGLDGEHFDPLLNPVLQLLSKDDSLLKNPPILLTSDLQTPSLISREEQDVSSFLQVTIRPEEMHNLQNVIASGSVKNFAVGEFCYVCVCVHAWRGEEGGCVCVCEGGGVRVCVCVAGEG